MSRRSARLGLGSLWLCGLLSCTKEESPPPAVPGQYPAYPPPAAYPAAPPQSPPPAYGTPPVGNQPPPATAPGAPPSQPSPLAFACQSDVQCLTHRCNTQVQKCAWPCQSNADCQPGFQCVSPACIPTMPPQVPPVQ